MTGLSAPFIPTLMSAPPSPLTVPLPLPPSHSPITAFSLPSVYIPAFFSGFEIFLFLYTLVSGSLSSQLHSPLPALPSLICPFFPPFRNSLSIALLTATHQPGCNLKSPSTAAIPQGWLSVQLPKPRQGLCFSKQL